MSEIVEKNNIEEDYREYLAKLIERCEVPFLPLLNGNKKRFKKLAAGFSFAFTENPDLKKCTRRSVVTGFRKCCMYNLDPSPELGKMYLIPRQNTKRGVYELVAQTGYQGLLEILMRSRDKVSHVYAQTVYEGDEFEITYGKDVDYRYVPKFKSTKLVLTFAVLKFKNGNIHIEYATKEEIDEARRRSKTDKVWSQHYKPMAEVVPLRKLVKRALSFNIDSDTYIDVEEEEKEIMDYKVTPVVIDNSNFLRLEQLCEENHIDPKGFAAVFGINSQDPETVLDAINKFDQYKQEFEQAKDEDNEEFTSDEIEDHIYDPDFYKLDYKDGSPDRKSF